MNRSHPPRDPTTGYQLPADNPRAVVNVARRLGVTYRQLNYWLAQGYFGHHNTRPITSGYLALITPEDLPHVETIVHELVAAKRAIDDIRTGRRWATLTAEATP